MTTTITAAVALPTTLSELILVGVRDMEALDPARYEPRFGVWHEPAMSSDACYVCLAGAVMAGTLGADIDRNYNAEDYDLLTCRQLYALDHARTGSYYRALALLSDDPDGLAVTPVQGAAIDRERENFPVAHRDFRSWDEARLFCGEMRDAAQRLAAVGL